METAKSFLAEQTKQGGKGKKTRPQEALAKVHLYVLAPFHPMCIMHSLLALHVLSAVLVCQAYIPGVSVGTTCVYSHDFPEMSFSLSVCTV